MLWPSIKKLGSQLSVYQTVQTIFQSSFYHFLTSLRESTFGLMPMRLAETLLINLPKSLDLKEL
jgi:hypothetical protein